MGTSGRRSSGFAVGALAGQYPDPGFGLPHSVGPALFDDCHDAVAAQWSGTTLGGSAPTWAQVAPSSWQEIGVSQITTTTTSGSGAVALRAAVADLYRIPPPGAIWACKVQMSTGTANYELWSGFASAAARVATADATQFVGIRAEGANVFGVVKNGAGAAAESTVDLGSNCEAAWRVFGFEVSGDTTTPSVQFFQIDALDSLRDAWDRTDIGDPVTTDMPSTTLFSCLLGLVTTSAASVAAQIDWWDLGGRCARG